MSTTKNPLRIIDLINRGADHFTDKGINNARREMEWFLCDILNCERIDLYLRFEEILNFNNLKKLRTMINRRISGEPFQQILGKGCFYGRDYKINKNVLTPRPETEILIERLKKNGRCKSLLDVGTGSGCIAITAALEQLAEKIYATDTSSVALEITRENMATHSVLEIQLACHDFLRQKIQTSFDVVISNPPYIPLKDMDSLQKEVIHFDPPKALTDDNDGLTFYRRFSEQFDNLINPGGYILLEIGGNSQKNSVETIFNNAGLNTKFLKDLQNDWRAVEIRK